jgi:hypothetical protein
VRRKQRSSRSPPSLRYLSCWRSVCWEVPRRGCRPRIDGTHKAIVTAQFEVAQGKVTQVFDTPAVVGEPDTAGAPLEDAPMIVCTEREA